jgi:hypothetical protein
MSPLSELSIQDLLSLYTVRRRRSRVYRAGSLKDLLGFTFIDQAQIWACG